MTAPRPALLRVLSSLGFDPARAPIPNILETSMVTLADDFTRGISPTHLVQSEVKLDQAAVAAQTSGAIIQANRPCFVRYRLGADTGAQVVSAFRGLSASFIANWQDTAVGMGTLEVGSDDETSSLSAWRGTHTTVFTGNNAWSAADVANLAAGMVELGPYLLKSGDNFTILGGTVNTRLVVYYKVQEFALG